MVIGQKGRILFLSLLTFSKYYFKLLLLPLASIDVVMDRFLYTTDHGFASPTLSTLPLTFSLYLFFFYVYFE